MTDRKSTRLNSSHTIISYAVFCLKKKKKRRQHGRPRRDTEHGTPHPAVRRPGGNARRPALPTRARLGTDQFRSNGVFFFNDPAPPDTVKVARLVANGI